MLNIISCYWMLNHRTSLWNITCLVIAKIKMCLSYIRKSLMSCLGILLNVLVTTIIFYYLTHLMHIKANKLIGLLKLLMPNGKISSTFLILSWLHHSFSSSFCKLSFVFLKIFKFGFAFIGWSRWSMHFDRWLICLLIGSKIKLCLSKIKCLLFLLFSLFW